MNARASIPARPSDYLLHLGDRNQPHGLSAAASPLHPAAASPLQSRVGADAACPSVLTWFVAGAAFGLVAYPFYAVFLGLPTKHRRSA